VVYHEPNFREEGKHGHFLGRRAGMAEHAAVFLKFRFRAGVVRRPNILPQSLAWPTPEHYCFQT